MVKQINVTFDNEEHRILVKKKGDRTWHEFIMLLNDYEESETIINK